MVVEKDEETEIPDKTTIILKKFSKDLPKEQEEFLNKVVDLNAKENEPKLEKLKQAIIQNCLLKLLNVKDLNITLYYYDIEDVKITNEDLTKYNENKQEEQIEVKYKIYKTTKDHNDKDISEFVDYYEETDGKKNYKTEKFKMDIYKLPDNFENHIYLCANDVAVKDISVKEHILPKNITIDGENNEKYKLLVLINDAEGYSFLNNHSNSERDDFNADEKLGNIDFTTKSTKQLIQEIKNSLSFIDHAKKPILFYDDFIDNIQTTLYNKFPQIKDKDDKMKETLKLVEEYKITHHINDKEASQFGLNDKRTLNHINDINKLHEIVGKERGIEVEERQQEIIKKYQQLIIIDKQRGGSEREVKTIESKEGQKSREQLAKEITELTTLLNKQELANYVIRRQIACEVLKHYNEQISNQKEHYNEEYFHNLIIPMGTTEKDNLENNLWMLNEDYSHYQYYSSNIKLKNVEYNGKKIFNEDIENEEVLQKCGITNKNCEDKQPDLLLFPKLGSVVIIDFKKPNEKCFDYEKQVRDYAKLMYSKTNEEFNNLKHFYCYIIGETYGVPDDHYKETPDLEGYFAFQPIKDFNNKKPDLTIYEEITKFSRIQKLADLRNQPFIDKLGIKENIKKIVAEIFNDKEKQD